ncbi:MAG TPA: hypothetical protein DCG28_05875 [Lachnospiraceae bacterium]|nr:hypothetical protein [Lachnospiraceae bacterium]
MKDKNIKHNLFKHTKIEIAAYLLSTFLLVFSFCFLSPMDVYLQNTSEFVIHLPSVAFPLLYVSVALFIVLGFGLSAFLKGKSLIGFSLFFLGIALACYVQVFFLNGDMKQITGDDFNYLDMTPFHVTAYFIWLITAFFPLLIWAIKLVKDQNNKEAKYEGFSRFIITASVIILGMQTAGFVSSLMGSDYSKKTGKDYLSYEKSFNLSSKKNVIVFLLDRMDVDFMEKYLDEDDHKAEILDGFTFYEDNLSEYTNTFPSVATMLTGVKYNGSDTWKDYIDKAWNGNTLPDKLKKNDYAVYLLLDMLTTYNSVAQIKPSVDNVSHSNVENEALNYFQIVNVCLRISGTRTLPYVAKAACLYNLKPDFSNSFFMKLAPDMVPNATGMEADKQFFEQLNADGLSLRDDKNVFVFTHLESIHGGLETGELSFKILEKYFDELKRLDIYDKSTIILVADHGRPFLDHELDGDLKDPICTSLLIKPENSRGKLVKDSKTGLSNKSFIPSVLEYAGLPHQEEGLSYNDVINSKLNGERILNLYYWFGLGHIENKGQFVVNGNSRDIKNWTYHKPS